MGIQVVGADSLTPLLNTTPRTCPGRATWTEGLKVPLWTVLRDNCLGEWVENKSWAAGDWDTSGSPAPLSLSSDCAESDGGNGFHGWLVVLPSLAVRELQSPC